MNHIGRPPLADRHVQGVEHELRPQMCCHRPSHDSAAENIEHDCDEQKPRERGNVRYVGNPELIRSLCGQLPIDKIGSWPGIASADRREIAFATARTLDTTVADNPCHALVADVNSGITEIGLESRA